jgi:hypothetical protein
MAIIVKMEMYCVTMKIFVLFMSTRETAFEMALLHQLDAEVLIGQLSYKQRSEIYNVKHGYDSVKKDTGKHSTGHGDAPLR